MGMASRIRELRRKTGKTDVEMSQLLGVNIHWYGDLEQHDDELVFTLTLGQAMKLASLLGVTLRDLFCEEPESGEPVPFEQLPQQIESWIRSEGISSEEAEDRIGWRLRELLAAPGDRGLQLPVMFYQDLAACLGVHWLLLVPQETKSE